MFYKIRNILYISALSLTIAVSLSAQVMAQGVVSLSEEAVNDDLNQTVPDEFAMFNETVDVVPAPAAAPKPAENMPNFGDDIFAPKMPEAQRMPEPANDLDMPLSKPATKAPASTSSNIGLLGDSNADIPDENLFSQMSGLEKQTALLNLELRREKVKTEIESIKNQRKQAIIQEQEKKEAQEKQKIEWEKAQEQKVLQEQQKLRELDIEFEKIRQERVLNSYKNKYLEDAQKWIAHDAELYKQIEQTKKDAQATLDDSKSKFDQIKSNVAAVNNKASELISAHKQRVDDLNAQISVLKARIIAQEKELENAKKNPFEDAADGGVTSVTETTQEITPQPLPELKLANMYAVMEIRGQGGELIAKLVNQDGTPFYVKKGTTLQSGHTIEEITSTYVKANKSGTKDYIYFSAGGILPVEQPRSNLKGTLEDAAAGQGEEGELAEFVTSAGIPGVGSAMMAR